MNKIEIELIRKEKIKKFLVKCFNDIYDNGLNPEDIDLKGNIKPNILYELESDFKEFAANIGLSAMYYKE